MPVLFDSSSKSTDQETPVIPHNQKGGVTKLSGKKEEKHNLNSITQIPWILSAFIITIIPLFLIPLLESIFPFSIPSNYQFIILCFWYLMTFAFIYVNFILWYYNVNLVTNERVVDIDFVYLLVQEVSATRITQIEDVTYRRVGILSMLFDYGNVFVQTAGTESNIEFLSIPRPKQVAQILIDLLGQST